ncbi:MAG: Nif3-like dinuclear metal center hexameric protein [Myxococcales bacterium]|nr:Nif3-like dinuclear metal center hexameric protein [Myxococcales bacterium]MCB9582909.1 Nif3-like dinuclear metal center hexameric protein [Polyangiaceae bacterium]
MAVRLADVLTLLDRIAPLRFAEPWDNVGLLVDPTSSSTLGVSRAFLTIELSDDVLGEAVERRAELIIAYHPPIFSGLKRLRQRNPEERVVLQAIRAELPVYSPHTALDAAPGGVNDWLASVLGRGRVEPLLRSAVGAAELKLVVFVPADRADALRNALSEEAGAGVIGNYSHCSFNLLGRGTFWGNDQANPQVGQRGHLESVDELRMEMVCDRKALPRVAEVIHRVHPYEEPAWEAYPLEPTAPPGFGMGRLLTLDEPAPLSALVDRVKRGLGLAHVRVAASRRHREGLPLRTAAVCAGAGGSLFEKAPPADLYLTGEMRHHDVRARVAAGHTVILCEHTNTERGYLPLYAQRIVEASGGALKVILSSRDRDPFETV